MTTAIRLARPDEADSVRDLVRTAYAKWVPVLGREPMPMTADYHALVADGDVYVMTNDNVIGAVLVLLLEPDHLLLDNICVHPAWQRTGIGDTLLTYVESFAREHHRHEIRLYTNALMTSNINYYLKHGYHETHRETTPLYTRVYMSKPLDS